MEPDRREGGVDLHLHSLHSDGLLTPSAMMDLAADLGLATVALTDHDGVQGLGEASSRGRERGIEVVPGVEVSTSHPRGGEPHVLGLGIDPGDAALGEGLARNRAARLERLEEIVSALRRAGIRIATEDVLAVASGSQSVGRPHVADVLVRAGVVRSRQEAFDAWLGDGKIAWVAKRNLTCAEAIGLIHGAGGVAVLAHPGRKWDPAVIEDLIRRGLDGLEVVHPSHGPVQVSLLRAAVERWGLLATGGSDNHGDADGLAAMRARRVPGIVAHDLAERLRGRRSGAGRGARVGARRRSPA